MNSNKPWILQKGPLLPYLEQALADRYEVTILDPDADNSAFLAQHGAKFVGLTSSARYGAQVSAPITNR